MLNKTRGVFLKPTRRGWRRRCLLRELAKLSNSAGIICRSARFSISEVTSTRPRRRFNLLFATIPQAPRPATDWEAPISVSRKWPRLARTLNERQNFAQAIPILWRMPGIISAFSQLAMAGRTKRYVLYAGVALKPDHLIALNNLGNAYRLQKTGTRREELLSALLK